MPKIKKTKKVSQNKFIAEHNKLLKKYGYKMDVAVVFPNKIPWYAKIALKLMNRGKAELRVKFEKLVEKAK